MGFPDVTFRYSHVSLLVRTTVPPHGSGTSIQLSNALICCVRLRWPFTWSIAMPY
ncbi:hypothetical protein [Pectobacterium phage Clickz_B2]|uniref:Uncharacterized protein n=4 Tax=Phimunavirus Clickz TaxID=2733338 RepID=A0A3G8FH79_9CAUD|nr:hypothetical protein [Pectobacterium phage Clickz_B2]AZF94230.1 hypothetical protein [Pectobacterium phage Clickz_B4]AZF94332.1 hypothetical protein [Pectobacterium phage Clickz_B6]AZF94469.1 hypothetical protein [Pectobacterium phage Clickz_B8]